VRSTCWRPKSSGWFRSRRGRSKWQLRLGGERLLARVTKRSGEALGLAAGREVFAVIKTVAIDRRSLSRQGDIAELDDEMETFDT
jgi:molybdopterin-binding protein